MNGIKYRVRLFFLLSKDLTGKLSQKLLEAFAIYQFKKTHHFKELEGIFGLPVGIEALKEFTSLLMTKGCESCKWNQRISSPTLEIFLKDVIDEELYGGASLSRI